jgi:hypothetical protein
MPSKISLPFDAADPAFPVDAILQCSPREQSTNLLVNGYLQRDAGRVGVFGAPHAMLYRRTATGLRGQNRIVYTQDVSCRYRPECHVRSVHRYRQGESLNADCKLRMGVWSVLTVVGLGLIIMIASALFLEPGHGRVLLNKGTHAARMQKRSSTSSIAA